VKKLFSLIVLISTLSCSKDKSVSSPLQSDPPSEANTQAENTPLQANAPNVYEFFAGPQGQLSIHIYSEGDIWIVEQNLIEEDGLPTPQVRRTFTNKQKAYAYAKNEFGIDESLRNDTALDQVAQPQVVGDFFENLSSEKVLWEAKNKWTWDWELKFAKWMREHLHPDFFQKLGIENDCADAYYQARIIFARENSLPVAFRLAGGGAWFTQKTMRKEWLKLKTDTDWKKDRRFLKVLDYIANTTYTHTLGRDTYPVKISTEGLIEGTAFLYLDAHSGHTLLVNEINSGDSEESQIRLPMYTLNSTVPKTVRPLYESMFYESNQPQKNSYGFTGFVRFRWPKSNTSNALVEAKDMPYYSTEQYEPEFMIGADSESEESTDLESNFSLVVFKHLNPHFDPTLRIKEGLEEVKEMLSARKEIILEGYQVCQKSCAEGSAEYEDWSTPSRDKRIKNLIQDLEKYKMALYNIKTIEDTWNKALVDAIIEIEGVSYLLSHVKWVFDNNFFNSDPNISPELRWNLSPEAFAVTAQNTLTPLLEKRILKINAKNKCLQSSCDLFSIDFIDNGTFLEDQKMQEEISIRSQYCTYAGKQICALFSLELAKLSTPVSIHPNFLVTWENVWSFNSDPNVSEERRWGALPKNLQSFELPGSWTLVQRYKDFLLFSNEYNYPEYLVKVFDISTKSIVASYTLTKGGRGTISETGKLAVTDIANTSVYVMDLTTKLTQILKLPEVTRIEDYFSITPTWINDSHLVVSHQNSLAVYVLNEDDTYSLDSYLPGFSLPSKESIAIKIVALPSEDGHIANHNIYIKNLLASENTLSFVFDIESALGFRVDYLSVTHTTSGSVLFNWTKYNETGSRNGAFSVNIETQEIKDAPLLSGYSYTLKKNVLSNSTYIADKYVTRIYFVSDSFEVLKTITLKEDCLNCYRSEMLQIGNDIYDIDSEKMELIKVAMTSGKENISDISGKYVLFNLEDSQGLTSTSLVDMSTGKNIISANYIMFHGNIEGATPLISLSVNYPVKENESLIYHDLRAILDPLNVANGSLATPFYFYDDEDGHMGGDDFEGEENDFNPVADIDAEIAQITTALPAASIQITGNKTYPENETEISVLQISDKKTLILFR
jgi:hypothetical protein